MLLRVKSCHYKKYVYSCKNLKKKLGVRFDNRIFGVCEHSVVSERDEEACERRCRVVALNRVRTQSDRPGWNRVLLDSGTQCHVCPLSLGSSYPLQRSPRVRLRGAGNHVVTCRSSREINLTTLDWYDYNIKISARF